MQIGFSQRIQLDWLEKTAQLHLAGFPKAEVERTLQVVLKDQLSVGGKAQRGNREKAISILLKTWVTVPDGLTAFRNEGLALLKALPMNGHLPLHWGMTIAVYPFFRIVAETVGRLLKLQESVAAVQVQRRIREQIGERETVARAARRILRCLVDWKVLADTQKKGVYRAEPKIEIIYSSLKTWLLEAVLISNGSDALPLRAILEGPALFPFGLGHINTKEIEKNHRLTTFRHALDEDMVSLSERTKSLP